MRNKTSKLEEHDFNIVNLSGKIKFEKRRRYCACCLRNISFHLHVSSKLIAQKLNLPFRGSTTGWKRSCSTPLQRCSYFIQLVGTITRWYLGPICNTQL